jgi:hypothetical protein
MFNCGWGKTGADVENGLSLYVGGVLHSSFLQTFSILSCRTTNTDVSSEDHPDCNTRPAIEITYPI